MDDIQVKNCNGQTNADFSLLLRAEKAEARIAALEQELEDATIEFTEKVTELESELKKFVVNVKSCI